MENPEIEKMWKQGFQHQQVDISQEEINNIRRRKSKNLIGKIKETAKADHYALLGGTIVPVAFLFYMEYYGFGIYLLVMLGALFLQNSILLKKLDRVELRDSTLDYLLEFRSAINYLQRYTGRLLSFGLPLLVVPSFMAGLELSGVPWESFFFSEDQVVRFAILLGFILAITIGAPWVYRLSVKLLYGKKLSRLDEMITDLESQRGE